VLEVPVERARPRRADASAVGDGADDSRRIVVAVVDEDDLGGDAGDGGGDAAQQLLDVGRLVAGRHQHGELGMGWTPGGTARPVSSRMVKVAGGARDPLGRDVQNGDRAAGSAVRHSTKERHLRCFCYRAWVSRQVRA
jgi:hypothetical protein